MPTPTEIKKLSTAKAKRLEALIEAVERRIALSQDDLSKSIFNQFLRQLDVKRGRVEEIQNRRTTTLFNKAYTDFVNTSKKNLVKSILVDIENILEDNHKFYRDTAKATATTEQDLKKIINRRLGIDADGKLVKNGYMQGVLDDSNVRMDLQRYIFKEMLKGVGYEDLKNGIELQIKGDPEKLGMFEKHYKTFSYDVYAQLAGFTSKLYADKLGLTYFIYNGGLIETSRSFCKQRNGKVFSNDEAEDWKEDPSLTAVPNKATYNWYIDRGGYNCRHSIDFIVEEVAIALRPDLGLQDQTKKAG